MAKKKKSLPIDVRRVGADELETARTITTGENGQTVLSSTFNRVVMVDVNVNAIIQERAPLRFLGQPVDSVPPEQLSYVALVYRARKQK